ncbi:MAG: alpha/beta hydrolase family protein [Amphiamblys sp. WSBS2006]|nr:MAG: alpha/beta hydrolase family protein [Amphiamblys sp. WSBS2006]
MFYEIDLKDTREDSEGLLPLSAVSGTWRVALLGIHFVLRNLFYHPGEDHSTPAEDCFWEVSVMARDKQRTTSYLCMEKVFGAEKRPTIVFMHGISDTTEARKGEALELLEKTRMNVFVVGYRGFGKSSDRTTPDMEGIIQDTRASISALKRIVTGRLFFFGQSLGSSVAIHVLRYHTADGLILENPFLSITRVVFDRLSFLGHVFRKIIPDEWDSIGFVISNGERFRELDIMILSSGKDTLTGPYHRDVLFESFLRAGCRYAHYCVFEGYSHEGLRRSASYAQKIKDFCLWIQHRSADDTKKSHFESVSNKDAPV